MNHPQYAPNLSSQIVCEKQRMHWALKAAKAIAGAKAPYDVVQLRPDPATSTVAVCAVNDKATLAVYVDATVCDISTQRDDVIEFDKNLLPILIAATSNAASHDDEVITQCGFTMEEQKVTVTDESGLSLGLEMIRVRRNTSVADIGNPLATMERVRRQLRESEAEEIYPLPAQLDAVTKVAKSLGGRIKIDQRTYMHESDAAKRIVASGSWWTLSVLDKPESMTEQSGESDQKTGLRIVGSTPLGGIS